jgi:hypothetical protein
MIKNGGKIAINKPDKYHFSPKFISSFPSNKTIKSTEDDFKINILPVCKDKTNKN